MRFTLYGNLGLQGMTLEELVAEQKRDQMLFARVEDSGCEGSYVEVCKWVDQRCRYERYAFEKLFGGEIEGHEDDSGYETAKRLADMINEPLGPSGDERAVLIHKLPSYGKPTPLEEMCQELLTSLEKERVTFRKDRPAYEGFGDSEGAVTCIKRYLQDAGYWVDDRVKA